MLLPLWALAMQASGLYHRLQHGHQRAVSSYFPFLQARQALSRAIMSNNTDDHVVWRSTVCVNGKCNTTESRSIPKGGMPAPDLEDILGDFLRSGPQDIGNEKMTRSYAGRDDSMTADPWEALDRVGELVANELAPLAGMMA